MKDLTGAYLSGLISNGSAKLPAFEVRGICLPQRMNLEEDRIMKKQRMIVFAVLAAILIASCACSLLPFAPSLPESRRLGDMTIHYPEGWDSQGQEDILVISPEEIGDFFDMQARPVFIAIFGFQDEWVSEIYEEAGDLLDEIADELMAESLGSKETVEGDGATWLSASAEGTFDLFERSVVGWLAVTVRGDEFAFILAAAPENEWEEYENTFDAMLERIEFD